MNTTIKIPIQQIKTFLSRAGSIKNENVIPISQFLRVKGEANRTLLYKANSNSFIVHEIEQENESEYDFLIEERSLSIACETVEDTCYFDPCNDCIKMTIGKYSQSSPTEDLNSFFKFPELDDNFEYTISGEVLDSINAASKFVYSGKEFISKICFVHLSNNAVCATDNKKSYYKKFELELPKLVLNYNMCSVLSKFGSIIFQSTESHYIFNMGNSIYGFIKEQYEAPDFELAYKTIQNIKRPPLVVNKSDLFTFSDKSSKLASGFIDTIEISDGEQSSISLSFNSETTKSATETIIEVQKNEKYHEPEPFLVSASILKSVLSSISSESVEMYFATHGKSKFLIFSEEQNHISFIMGMTA